MAVTALADLLRISMLISLASSLRGLPRAPGTLAMSPLLPPAQAAPLVGASTRVGSRGSADGHVGVGVRSGRSVHHARAAVAYLHMRSRMRRSLLRARTLRPPVRAGSDRGGHIASYAAAAAAVASVISCCVVLCVSYRSTRGRRSRVHSLRCSASLCVLTLRRCSIAT